MIGLIGPIEDDEGRAHMRDPETAKPREAVAPVHFEHVAEAWLGANSDRGVAGGRREIDGRQIVDGARTVKNHARARADRLEKNGPPEVLDEEVDVRPIAAADQAQFVGPRESIPIEVLEESKTALVEIGQIGHDQHVPGIGPRRIGPEVRPQALPALDAHCRDPKAHGDAVGQGGC